MPETLRWLHDDCTCCRQWRKVEFLSAMDVEELRASGKLRRLWPAMLPPFEAIPPERAIVRG